MIKHVTISVEKHLILITMRTMGAINTGEQHDPRPETQP